MAEIQPQAERMKGWTASHLEALRAGHPKSWIYALTPEDIRDIDSALAYALDRGMDAARFTASEFPCGQFEDRLKGIRIEVESGCGVALIRGLPVWRYTPDEASTVFLGLGAHFGRAVAQNAFGDVVGHVTDLGGDWTTQMSTRGYETTQLLPFHTDSCDIVGLLCLQKAQAGGLSSIASSSAIHDALLQSNPDRLFVLYGLFAVDRRGEEPGGQLPYYQTPIFAVHSGKLFARYNRTYIESAQRFADVARLTRQQRDALDALDTLCANPTYHFNMQLEPGDVQFLNNYKVLHSRSQYVDFDTPKKRRHLLRLWLFNPAMRDIPERFEERYRDMAAWQQNPRVPTMPSMRGTRLGD